MEEQTDKALKSRRDFELTRLQHINEEICRVSNLIRALKNYGDLYAEYNAQRTKLTEIRRQEAMLSTDASQIRCYESAEEITAPVVRLCYIREEIKTNANKLHELQGIGHDTTADVNDSHKQVAVRLSEIENTRHAMEDSMEVLREHQFKKGRLMVLESIISEQESLLNQITQHKVQNQQSIRSLNENIELKTKNLERVKSNPVTGHADMLQQISIIMPRLQNLQLLKAELRLLAEKQDKIKTDTEKETSEMNLLREKTQTADQQIQRQLEIIASLRINSNDEDNTMTRERIETCDTTIHRLTAEREDLFRQISRINISYGVHLEQQDNIRIQRDATEDAYMTLLNGLNHSITLHDWHTTFEKDPSIVIRQIESIRLDWESYREQTAELTQQITLLQKILQEKSEQQQLLEEWSNHINNHLIELNHQRQQLKQETNEMAPDGSLPEEYHLKKREALREEISGISTYIENYQEKCRELCHVEGKVSTMQQLDTELRTRMEHTQNQIDQWLHLYSSHHAPLQYVQLEEMLTGEHPWSKHRGDVIQNSIELAVTESKLSDLSQRMDILQGETGALRPEELSSHMAKADMEMENLLKQQMETALKLAHLEMQIKIEI